MMNSLSDRLRLENKVAIVTGGAMGIGAAIAELLAAAGAAVAVLDTERLHLHRVTEKISAAGGWCKGFVCDVGNLTELRRTVDAVVAEFDRLDIVVNNAGIFPLAPALELSEATWDRVLDVNLKGPFFLAQCAAHQMIRQGSSGSIVNIASIDAIHPSGKLTHYDASKAGMQMMSRSLALELAPHHIRVNTVAPGAIDTPGASAAMATVSTSHEAERPRQSLAHIPLGRMGTPEEIAQAVLFLASEAASYITGSTLVVDGGFLVA